MAKLLFRLNDVEFDEAEAVRALLEEHDYAFYETQAGMFGFSLAGIWLHDDSRFDAARALLDTYGEERAQSFREALAQGQAPTMWQYFLRRPIATLVITASALGVLAISLWPFLRLGQ